MMRKNERIGVRLPAEMKRTLTRIASKEGRSLAQICEIFLKGGIASYRKEGPKYVQRFLSRQKKESASQ
jgi:hypothetical protein